MADFNFLSLSIYIYFPQHCVINKLLIHILFCNTLFIRQTEMYCFEVNIVTYFITRNYYNYSTLTCNIFSCVQSYIFSKIFKHLYM